MSDKLVTTPALPGATGVKRLLKKEKFNPIKQLLTNVYPMLDPKDQARICMELIGYCYTKPEKKVKRRRAPQTNVQVNVTPAQQVDVVTQSPPATSPSREELLRIAASAEE